MKRIEGKVPFLVIPIPKLAFYFDWVYALHKYDKNNNPRINIYWETEDDRIYGVITDFIDPNQFEILGKYSELTENQIISLIDFSIGLEDTICFKDYTKEKHFTISNPKESLKSLLISQDLYLKDWITNVYEYPKSKASEEFLIILING